MVHPDSHRVPRVPWYSGIPPDPRPFRLRGFHLLRPAFPDRSAKDSDPYAGPYNPRVHVLRFGLFPFRSPLLRESLLDFSSWSYLDGSVHSVRLPDLCIQSGIPPIAVGFPIRIPPDQRSFDSYPELFAAFYVLLRLLLPRHPPYTLKFLLCRLPLLSS